MLSSRRLRRRFVATVAALAALAAMAPGTAQALYAAHSAIVSEHVVAPATLRVAQDLVGPCDFPEAILGVRPRTVYEPSTAGKPNGLEEVWGPGVLEPSSVVYEAERPGPGGVSIATGELYDVLADPLQWHNRWDDPTVRALREDLISDLYDHLPSEVRSLPVAAPA